MSRLACLRALSCAAPRSESTAACRFSWPGPASSRKASRSAAPPLTIRSRQASASRNTAFSRRALLPMASSPALTGSGSTSRISRPMYCFWRRRAPRELIRFAARTASRSRSSATMPASCSSERSINRSPSFCRARSSRLRADLLGFEFNSLWVTVRSGQGRAERTATR